MSPDTRWMSSISAPAAGPAVKTTSAPPSPAAAAPPVEARPAVGDCAAGPRSTRAAAIRARSWQAAWGLALRHPSVATFEGLAANPAASLERALRWYVAGTLAGFALPALLSVWRGAANLIGVGVGGSLLALLSVGAFALGTAVACALAAHLEAYGLRWRPSLLEREPPLAAPSAGGLTPGVFQRAVYQRLAFACAAFAAPASAALGLVLALPGLLRGLLLLGLSLYGVALTIVAVRAACRVTWTWALVAGASGALSGLVLLAAVAGAWVGLLG
jgi:hypothetical protein